MGEAGAMAVRSVTGGWPEQTENTISEVTSKSEKRDKEIVCSFTKYFIT